MHVAKTNRYQIKLNCELKYIYVKRYIVLSELEKKSAYLKKKQKITNLKRKEIIITINIYLITKYIFF